MCLLTTNHQHDLSGVQSGKDVGLESTAQLVFQGDPGEDLITFLGQRIINVLCVDTVLGAVTLVVGFFVADKDIKGVFLAGNLQNAFLQFINGGSLSLLDLFPHRISISNCAQIVRIVKDGYELSPVDGWDPLVGMGIFHVFNAVTAKNDAPVSFCIGLVLTQDHLIMPMVLSNSFSRRK